MKFGQNVGLMGLEHGGIQVDRVGELEAKDVTRHRIKWYAGLALFREQGVSRLESILPQSARRRVEERPVRATPASPAEDTLPTEEVPAEEPPVAEEPLAEPTAEA